MWIFTDTGFVSAVAHYDNPDMIVARARDWESLKGVASIADTPVMSTPHNDYPYRVHVSRAVFQRWLNTSVAEMEYTNFKDRVHETRGDRFYYALSSVWNTMHEVEERN